MLGLSSVAHPFSQIMYCWDVHLAGSDVDLTASLSNKHTGPPHPQHGIHDHAVLHPLPPTPPPCPGLVARLALTLTPASAPTLTLQGASGASWTHSLTQQQQWQPLRGLRQGQRQQQ